MAGFFQQFLQGAADGFLGAASLRDYKHASKTFTTNAYEYSPKFKWLFHVFFDVNSAGLIGQDYSIPAEINHGLLVKTAQLPKFNGNIVEMNQYNRKRYIHQKITYDPITITFHDDNGNHIKNLWTLYYTYYFLDATNKVGSYPGNAPGGSTTTNVTNLYDNSISGQDNWGYNGAASTSAGAISAKAPFFNNIKIFGFNQHEFACYELINPLIDNFQHDTYDYSQVTGTMENSMTLRYETVKYYEGAMNGQSPSNVVNKFGLSTHYDTEPSPLARPGSTRQVLGPGGLVDAGIGIVGDITSGDPLRILRAAQTAGTAARTFKNSESIVRAAQTEVTQEAIRAIEGRGTFFNFPLPRVNNNTSQVNAPPIPTFNNTQIR